MGDVWYPSVMDVVGLHAFIVERSGQIPGELLDSGKLESALMRPQMAAYYEGADLPTQAALLITAIVLCHAFEDGNKRAAVIAGDTFLWQNGYDLRVDELELERRIVGIASAPEEREGQSEALAQLIRDHLELRASTDTK